MDGDPNRVLILERKLAFITEKLESFEKNTGPLYYLLPVRVFDLCLIEDQKKDQQAFLLAVLHRPKDTQTNVIKVSRDVLGIIANSTDEITIDDFILTEHLAERRLKKGKWVWVLIQ